LWEIRRKETRYLLVYKEVQKMKCRDFRDKYKKEDRATGAEVCMVL